MTRQEFERRFRARIVERLTPEWSERAARRAQQEIDMGFFRPQDGRTLAGFFSNMVKKWDALTPEEKASGDYINPDEPVVLSVPNPEWTGGDDICDEDDYGNERHLYFHVQSHGGGGDMDEDGNECGHDGAAISGMEIEQPAFFYNGRRAGTVIKYGPAKGRT